jgi:hypothetical protein
VRLREFSPPVEEGLTGGYVLHLTAALPNGQGGYVANLDLWNGEPRYTDRVPLTSDIARRRFVRQAVQVAPTLTEGEVGTALVRLKTALPTLMQQQEAPGDSPAVDVDALWDACRTLAEAADLLTDPGDPAKPGRLDAVLDALSLVGERRNAKLLFLAAVARLLEKLINCFVRGPPPNRATCAAAQPSCSRQAAVRAVGRCLTPLPGAPPSPLVPAPPPGPRGAPPGAPSRGPRPRARARSGARPARRCRWR